MRKINGTTCKADRIDASLTYIRNADGAVIGKVVPTRGLSADFGAKWHVEGDRNETFVNLRDAARFFVRGF